MNVSRKILTGCSLWENHRLTVTVKTYIWWPQLLHTSSLSLPISVLSMVKASIDSSLYKLKDVFMCINSELHSHNTKYFKEHLKFEEKLDKQHSISSKNWKLNCMKTTRNFISCTKGLWLLVPFFYFPAWSKRKKGKPCCMFQIHRHAGVVQHCRFTHRN